LVKSQIVRSGAAFGRQKVSHLLSRPLRTG